MMHDVNPFRRQRTSRPSSAGERASVRSGTGAEVEVHGALLRKASLGDEQAFSELYDRTASMVYGIVLKVLRDPAQSEEVTQEVFVEVWRLAPRFDSTKGSARSWIATMAHRRAVDRVRSSQAARDRETNEGVKQGRAFDSVAETVEDNMDRQRVKKALETLTDRQREAVELAYYGGHTYREVAVLLDVAEGTVKTRIRDGLLRLRDEMGVAI